MRISRRAELGLSGSGLCVHRSGRRTALLLFLRPMQTRLRTAYSVSKIGKGSFLTSDLTRFSPHQAGPLQHHIRRPALAQPRSNNLSPLAILVPSRPPPLLIEAHPTPSLNQRSLSRRVRVLQRVSEVAYSGPVSHALGGATGD